MRHFKLFSALLVLLSFALVETSAQPGGGGGGGGMGGPGGGGPSGGGPGMMSASADPLEMLGLFEIDADDVIKRSKIKDGEQQTAVRKAVAAYIIEYGNVVSENSEVISKLESMKDKMSGQEGGQSMGGGQRGSRGESEETTDATDARTAIREGSTAIRTSMAKAHTTLNKTIKIILKDNSKSLSKWSAYYESLCEDKSYNPNMSQRSSRGQGGQGEQGGGQGGQRPTR